MFEISRPGEHVMKLVLIGLVMMAPTPQQGDEATRRAQALDALRQLGARMTFDLERPDRPLVSLQLAGPKVTDEVMPLLRQFLQLNTLYLTGTRVTDKGLEELRYHKNIRVLLLTYSA